MKTVIEMAREAGFNVYKDFPNHTTYLLERFAALVREDEREKIRLSCKTRPQGKSVYPEFVAAVLAEREACAKVCEKIHDWYPTKIWPEDGESLDCKSASMARLTANNCAAAIRARSE